jgi:hypothetical protein
MVGGTSFPPHDSKSEPWSNEQKTKATPKPSTKGKAKSEARTLAGRGIATGALEVSLDNADTVTEGAPCLRALCATVGFHNCLIHGTLIARCAVKQPQPRHQWNPTPSTPLRAGSNVEEREKGCNPSHFTSTISPPSDATIKHKVPPLRRSSLRDDLLRSG